MPEEHVEEGDVDGLLGPSVVFDLVQDHLQPENIEGDEEEEKAEETYKIKDIYRQRVRWQQNTEPIFPQILEE